MEKQDAPAAVADIGVFLFQHQIRYYDNFDDGMESILKRIKDEAFRDKMNQTADQPGFWESREEALELFLEQYEKEEYDRILKFYFGIYPEELAGNSKAFFEKLHAAVQNGLNEARGQGRK